MDTGQLGVPFRPLVLGPARVPLITTQTQARKNIELALLSVLARGRTDQGPAIVEAAVGAVLELEGERSGLSFELPWRSASTALRRHLEQEMRVGNYEFQNEEIGHLYQKCIEARQEGKLEARQEGKLEAVREIARKLLSGFARPVCGRGGGGDGPVPRAGAAAPALTYALRSLL